MKIEYKLKQEDYKNALIELLRKEFWKRVILIILIPLIISLIIAAKPINWKIFIISFLISFFGIIIFFFGRSLFNIYKTDVLTKKNPLYIGEKRGGSYLLQFYTKTDTEGTWYIRLWLGTFYA